MERIPIEKRRRTPWLWILILLALLALLYFLFMRNDGGDGDLLEDSTFTTSPIDTTSTLDQPAPNPNPTTPADSVVTAPPVNSSDTSL